MRHPIIALALLVVVLGGCRSKPAATETGPLAAGTTPPPITLTSLTGARVALADVTHAHAQTVVVFYVGFY